MNKLLFLILSNISLFAVADNLSKTDRYLGYAGHLLEIKEIGDENLLRMIHSAEKDNAAVNPILEIEAKVRIEHRTAFDVFGKILSETESIEINKITPWARERLSEQAKADLPLELGGKHWIKYLYDKNLYETIGVTIVGLLICHEMIVMARLLGA